MSILWNVLGIVFSGVVGNLLGWYATSSAASRAEEAQATRDAAAGKSQVRAVLQAIAEELRAVHDIHYRDMGPYLDQYDGEEGVALYYPVSNDYFAIFHANAPSVGTVDDAVLRAKIVRTYVYLKALVDTFRMNNHIIQRCEAAEFWAMQNPDSEAAATQAEQLSAQMREYGPKVVASHRRAMKEYLELEALLRSIGV